MATSTSKSALKEGLMKLSHDERVALLSSIVKENESSVSSDDSSDEETQKKQRMQQLPKPAKKVTQPQDENTPPNSQKAGGAHPHQDETSRKSINARLNQIGLKKYPVTSQIITLINTKDKSLKVLKTIDEIRDKLLVKETDKNPRGSGKTFKAIDDETERDELKNIMRNKNQVNAESRELTKFTKAWLLMSESQYGNSDSKVIIDKASGELYRIFHFGNPYGKKDEHRRGFYKAEEEEEKEEGETMHGVSGRKSDQEQEEQEVEEEELDLTSLMDLIGEDVKNSSTTNKQKDEPKMERGILSFSANYNCLFLLHDGGGGAYPDIRVRLTKSLRRTKSNARNFQKQVLPAKRKRREQEVSSVTTTYNRNTTFNFPGSLVGSVGGNGCSSSSSSSSMPQQVKKAEDLVEAAEQEARNKDAARRLKQEHEEKNYDANRGPDAIILNIKRSKWA